jgi:hypothetical protein
MSRAQLVSRRTLKLASSRPLQNICLPGSLLGGDWSTPLGVAPDATARAMCQLPRPMQELDEDIELVEPSKTDSSGHCR